MSIFSRSVSVLAAFFFSPSVPLGGESKTRATYWGARSSEAVETVRQKGRGGGRRATRDHNAEGKRRASPCLHVGRRSRCDKHANGYSYERRASAGGKYDAERSISVIRLMKSGELVNGTAVKETAFFSECLRRDWFCVNKPGPSAGECKYPVCVIILSRPL